MSGHFSPHIVRIELSADSNTLTLYIDGQQELHISSPRHVEIIGPQGNIIYPSNPPADLWSDERYIDRHVGRGWRSLIRIKRKLPRPGKPALDIDRQGYFADDTYGDHERSLEAALAWRDATCVELGLPIPAPHSKPGNRGVHKRHLIGVNTSRTATRGAQ